MKIAYRLIERLAQLTNKEMDMFLYLARYQNDSGVVENVFYKSIMDKTGMCKQTYYNTMDSLEKKGIIRVLSRTKGDVTLYILDNDFSSRNWNAGNEGKKGVGGYINLNRNIFHDERFWQLKAREKWLLLELMKNTHVENGTHEISCFNFYDKYSKLLGVKIRILRDYIHKLKEFFFVRRKSKKYFITAQPKVFKDDLYEKKTQYEQQIEYFILAKCRINKIKKPSEELLKNVYESCFRRRSTLLKKAGYDIRRVFAQILPVSVKDKVERVLDPKYINKLITIAIS